MMTRKLDLIWIVGGRDVISFDISVIERQKKMKMYSSSFYLFEITKDKDSGMRTACQRYFKNLVDSMEYYVYLGMVLLEVGV